MGSDIMSPSTMDSQTSRITAAYEASSPVTVTNIANDLGTRLLTFLGARILLCGETSFFNFFFFFFLGLAAEGALKAATSDGLAPFSWRC